MQKSAILRTVAVVIALCFPAMTLANSSDTEQAFENYYSVSSPGCSFCHGTNDGIAPTAASPKYGRDYLQRIQDTVSDSSLDTDGIPGFDRNQPADLNQIVAYLDTFYTPKLSSVDGNTASGTGATSLQISPVTGNNTFPVGFNAGLSNLGTTSSLASVTASSGLSESISSPVGNAATVTVSLTQNFIRGRSASRSTIFPVVLKPVNASGFMPVAGVMAQRNTVNLRFANLLPQGTADTLNKDNTGRDGAAWVLDVLANDDDPDSATSPGRSNAVPPTLGCVSAVSTGTLVANGTDTALLYTPPSPLPPSPVTVTFSYCPIDNESGAGALVTSSITVPAPTNADAPNAQNAVFDVTEDILFGDDLSSRVTTTAAGGPVTFSLEVAPANGSASVSGNGQFTYTTNADYNGTDSFVYRATNAAGAALATVTITADPANDAPVANATAPIDVNDTIESLPIDLVGTLYVTDIDGDTLTVSNLRVAPIEESFRAPEEIFYDSNDLTKLDGNTLTIFPSVLKDIDNGDSAKITVTYDISDGEEVISTSLVVVINGIDNDLGRQPGLYADSIRDRYNNHFKGFEQQGEGACLTCHLPGRVGIDVDFLRDCEQTPPVFNAYGLALCLDRTEGQGALTNLPQRMANAEPRFAPKLSIPTIRLQIGETASAGDPIGDPLSVESAGQTIDGATSQIVEYLMSRGVEQAPANTDASGNFAISASGQLSVAAGAQLVPGSYPLFILPVNDAGQKNADGGILGGLPGFYPADNPPSITVFVGAVPTEPAPDQASTFADQAVTVDVLTNDGGGQASAVSVVAGPGNGSATVNGDLTITYLPSAGFVGEDSFTYTSSNTAGSADNPARVTILVLSEGSILAVDDAVNVAAGRKSELDVLGNDQNVQRGGANATVVTLTTALDPATEGLLEVQGQSVMFSAAADAKGPLTFTYSARNPNVSGDTGSQATVTINLVEFGGGVLSEAAISPELQDVARSFEMSCQIVQNAELLDEQAQQFLDVCVDLTLAGGDPESLTQAMQALRNEEHLAVVDATATVARSLGRVLGRRLSEIKNGAARGFNTAAVNLTIDGETLPIGLVTQAARGFLGLGLDAGATPAWGLFIAGDFVWAEKDGSANSRGYDLQSNNLMLGYDLVLDDRNSIGVALGFSQSDTDFGDGGVLKSEGYQLTAYGLQKDFLTRDLTLDGYISFGQMDFASDRVINFSSGGTLVDEVANADFAGTYLNIVPRLSYAQVLGDYGDPIGALRTATRLTWSASLDYLRLNVDGYTETGGGGLALNVASETYDSVLLSVGVDASRPIYLGPDITSELYGGLQVQGELLDETRSLSAAFAAAGPDAPRFLVTEDGTQGLGAQVQIGTQIRFGAQSHFDLSYSYGVRKGGLTTQSTTLGYSFEVLGNDSLTFGVTRGLSNSAADQTTADLNYSLRF